MCFLNKVFVGLNGKVMANGVDGFHITADSRGTQVCHINFGFAFFPNDTDTEYKEVTFTNTQRGERGGLAV